MKRTITIEIDDNDGLLNFPRDKNDKVIFNYEEFCKDVKFMLPYLVGECDAMRLNELVEAQTSNEKLNHVGYLSNLIVAEHERVFPSDYDDI